VIVDSKSTDGSAAILRDYFASGKIKLIEQQCSRGRGRQLAFENSVGKYIISGVDMDDIYGPRISEMLVEYHSRYEGKMVRFGLCSTTVAPRDLIESLGGWNDMNWFEDSNLWNRAAKNNFFVERFDFNVVRERGRKSRTQRAGDKYEAYYWRLKEGRRAKADLKTFPLYIAAKLALLLGI
jgi:glycosyltransferase involved in cell wall biosynthesis